MILFRCLVFLLSFSCFAQNQEYQFYNQTNAALLEDYYITIFSKSKTNHFYADDEAKVSLDKKLILASDSIQLNANFQKMKISKASFNSNIIEVELSQDLDEVVLTDKKNLFWIGAEKGNKLPMGIGIGVAVAIGIDSLKPVKIYALEIPIKGRILFHSSSYKSKFLVRLYEVDDGLKIIRKINEEDLIYQVKKRGSHKLQIDLSNLNYEVRNEQAHYIVVRLNRFSGDTHFKTGDAKNNPSAMNVTGIISKKVDGNIEHRFYRVNVEELEFVVKVRLQLERVK
ncbi:hypothetical protein [Psychroflexus planctonicus]|nr:hypothetical protein [Psychroflexus planctonicus]